MAHKGGFTYSTLDRAFYEAGFKVRVGGRRPEACDLYLVAFKEKKSEEEVKNTIITLAENLKIITEPGGAVAAAAVLSKKINTKNKNVVVMISGGNIDSEMFLSL